ncbi:TonB-dependent siderophore receptor [Kordiimonas pumila]|uniref:TonB-dependent siderophore receptor n=1 Tax=Kordiimonas pumila TaxID=2161677 RepID=A0ABV7D643_9PROT|nr:TonB-dependent siderophore receptor [Kordiimonas pumila]
MSKKNIRSIRSGLFVATAAVLSSYNYAVMAEEAEETTLETISIVAHKLTELEVANNSGALGNRSVMDTPFSVDVISLEDMEIRQVNTLDSLFSREASVSVDGSAYSTFGDTIRVRGLPLDYTNSFKINGMSVNNFGGELPYEAFQQVTLLKGATGFMYGMAAPGGTVNYVTKKPVNDLLSVDFGLRSDSVLSGHIDAGTRFGRDDAYGVRVNLVKENGNTYLDNGKIDRETAALAFDAHLSDSLYWTVDLMYSDRLTENSWTVMDNYMDSSEPIPETVSGTRSIGIDGTFDRYKTLLAITSLNWDINENWTARLEYDYSKNETRWVKTLAELQNSDGDVAVAIYDQYFDISFSQLQGVINGEFETGFLKHQIVMGVAYQEATTYRNDPNRRVIWGYGMDNLYDPVAVPTYTSTLEETLTEAWVDKQSSAFISDTLKFAEKWEFLVGIRANKIEYTPSEYWSSYFDVYKDTAVSPTAALMFKPADRTTFYASYVEAFEGSTSVVSETYANANELLPPLKSKQYEFGVKSAGNGWTVTGALFRIERGAEIVTADNYLVQDGITIYQGAELSSAVEITKDLSLYGDVMLLDTEYKKTNTGIEGNDVAGTPKMQASLQANYVVEAISGLTLNFGGKYHGKTVLDSANNWDLPSYTIFYAGASYSTLVGGKQVTFIATMDNVFDKKYWAVGDSYGALRIGEPMSMAFKTKIAF